MVALLVMLSLLGVFYAYAGYPLLLLWIRKEREIDGTTGGNKPKTSTFLLPITVVITVRNERAVIAEKVEQTLYLQYGPKCVGEHLAEPASVVQVIVASDCSDDGTDELVRSFLPVGVEPICLPERGGKERAQKAALESARGAVIVFTDAKIKLNPDALDRFRTYFVDPSVGAVSSVDQVDTTDGAGSGEGLYIRYEMWLRGLESDYKTLVGLSGSCFAVRRELCEGFRTDVPSDFAMLIESQKRGLRGVHAPDIVGTYKAVKTEQEEFTRKVRTVLRGMTAFFRYKEVLNFVHYGSFSWQLLSHKFCRWLVPWCMLIATLGSVALAPSSPLFLWFTYAFTIFYAFAALAYSVPFLRRLIPFKACLFFVVSNAAIAVAWLKYLSGDRAVSWDPSAKM